MHQLRDACGSSHRAHRYPHVKKFVAQSLRTIACTLQYPRTLYPWLPETKQHRGKTVSCHPTWLASDVEKQHAREMKWHLTPTVSQKRDSGKVGLKKFHIKKDGASLRLSYDRATVIQANIIQGGKILAWIFSWLTYRPRYAGDLKKITGLGNSSKRTEQKTQSASDACATHPDTLAKVAARLVKTVKKI